VSTDSTPACLWPNVGGRNCDHAPLPARVSPGKPVTFAHADPLGLTRGEFEHVPSAESNRDSERSQVVSDRADAEGSIEEDDVDREAHEQGMNRGGLRDEQSFTGAKTGAPEQATRPGVEGFGAFASNAHDSTAFVDERSCG
jgi:hypothetical protein